MSNYRRTLLPGGTFFFTVVTYQRVPVFTSDNPVELLRQAFRTVMRTRPFHIDAIVVMPDHLHCLWQLPPDDADYSGRWREIKKFVSRRMTPDAVQSLWQRRFWEHSIRDQNDWRRHMDYIHYIR